jgi:3-deoxy-manno-octulosonate cytidylyltransferase (CMP-KDO synthetase)
MTFTVLVPARLASTRLPNKPLADIAGVPMIVRVARNAARSAAARVVVAADDARIVEACRAHGVDALLTRSDHATGSDRLAQACELLGLDGTDLVVNVQGDEPLLAPEMIDACASLLAQHADCVMSTCSMPPAARSIFRARRFPGRAMRVRQALRRSRHRRRCATSVCTRTRPAFCAASRH